MIPPALTPDTVHKVPTPCGKMSIVPSPQSPREIDELFTSRVHGRSIRRLQVLGVNSLKTVNPHPDALIGAEIASTVCDGRLVTIATANYTVLIDLQRTGRVVWLSAADVWQPASGTPQPSARLLLDDGTGIDLIEPAKTKRITVSLIAGPA